MTNPINPSDLSDDEIFGQYDLYDSETGAFVSVETLGFSYDEYVQTIRESLGCDQAEGHVRVRGRRVYAKAV